MTASGRKFPRPGPMTDQEAERIRKWWGSSLEDTELEDLFGYGVQTIRNRALAIGLPESRREARGRPSITLPVLKFMEQTA